MASSARRSRRRNTRVPASDSSAGSSEMAMSTAIATVPAAASPMMVRNGIPTTDRPASAMSTVSPANTTAEPAVPVARPIDSSMAIPARSWFRCRDTMNRA